MKKWTLYQAVLTQSGRMVQREVTREENTCSGGRNCGNRRETGVSTLGREKTREGRKLNGPTSTDGRSENDRADG